MRRTTLVTTGMLVDTGDVTVSVVAVVAAQVLAGVGVSLTGPETVRHLWGTPVFAMLCALIGLAVGALVRHSAGAVAIAAGYSAVYPRESPGGWYLLGHTTIGLWDEDATPPALLAPGTVVRFVDANGAS